MNKSKLVHCLAAAFGMASWLAVNGAWVELPILVNVLPESWNLASIMSVVIQLANIVPLGVTLLNHCCPRYLHLSGLIYSLLTLGVLSQVLLFFYWNVQINEKSIPFFILFFGASVVDCTSSVSFIPFMTRLQTRFLQSYFLGEGLSGFIPAIAGLFQGVNSFKCNGTEPEFVPARFGVESFFLLLGALAFCSLCSFFAISVYCRNYFVEDAISSDTHFSDISNRDESIVSPEPEFKDDNEERTAPLTWNEPPQETNQYSTRSLYVMLFILCFFSNGFMPSISTFVAMPYGSEAYHTSTILSTVANPIACLLVALFEPVFGLKAKRAFLITFLITLALTAFHLLLAVGSPCPILVDSWYGSMLMVCTTTLYSFFTTIIKVSFAGVLRNRVQSSKFLLWFGAITQVGSFCGAIVCYPLVNTLQLFQSRYPCQACPI